MYIERRATDQETMNPRKQVITGRFVLVLGALLFACALLCSLHMYSGHTWGGDFALYISQAIAMDEHTTGALYAASSKSCEGNYMVINPELYPPGFPAMLLPVYKMFGVNYTAFKWLEVFCLLAWILLVAVYTRLKTDSRSSLLVAGALVSSYQLVAFTNHVIADIPLAMLITACLCLAVLYRPRKPALRWAGMIMTGLLMAAAYQVKSVAVSFIAAYCCYMLYRWLKEGESFANTLAGLILPLAVFGLATLLVSMVYPAAGSGYVKYLAELDSGMVWNNIRYYFAIAPREFLFHSTAFFCISACLFLLGFVSSFKQHVLAAFMIIFQLLLLVFWPYQGGLRYVFFLLPFFLYFSLLGCYRLFAFRGLQRYERLKPLFFLVLIGYGLFYQVREAYRTDKEAFNEIGSPEATGLFAFVRERTEPTDRFIFFKPNVLRLIAQRESSCQVSRDGIDRSGAQYWIFRHEDPQADTTGLQEVFRNGAFTVYRLPGKER